MRVNSKWLYCLLLLMSMSIAVPIMSAERPGRKVLVFSESGHLLPEIVSILKSMQYYSTAGDSAATAPYFSNITLLNALFLGEQYRLEVHQLRKDFMLLADQLKYAASPEFKQSQEEIKFAENVVNSLRQFNSYLHIQSVQSGNFIEFRIFFTDEISLEPKRGQIDIRPYLFNEKTRYFGFMLNIEQDKYKDDLAFNLKRNFPGANVLPTCEIRVAGPAVFENGQYYTGVGDTIMLKLETNIEFPKYSQHRWQMISSPTNGAVVNLQESGFSQQVSFKQAGTYKIAVRLSDFIHDPVTSAITINARNKPEFIIPKKLFSSSRFKIPFYWNSDSKQGDLYVSARKTLGPRADFERPAFKDSLRLTKDRDVLFNSIVQVSDTERIMISSLSLPGTYQVSLVASDAYVSSEPQNTVLQLLPKRTFQFYLYAGQKVLNRKDLRSAKVAQFKGGLQFNSFLGFYILDKYQVIFEVFTFGMPKIVYLSGVLPLTTVVNPYGLAKFPFYFGGVELNLDIPFWFLYEKDEGGKVLGGGGGLEATIWYKRTFIASVGYSIGVAEGTAPTYLTYRLGFDLFQLVKSSFTKKK